MWISVLWHSRFHCPGIVLLGTQKYDIEAYTGIILNFFLKFSQQALKSIIGLQDTMGPATFHKPSDNCVNRNKA